MGVIYAAAAWIKVKIKEKENTITLYLLWFINYICGYDTFGMLTDSTHSIIEELTELHRVYWTASALAFATVPFSRINACIQRDLTVYF